MSFLSFLFGYEAPFARPRPQELRCDLLTGSIFSSCKSSKNLSVSYTNLLAVFWLFRDVRKNSGSYSFLKRGHRMPKLQRMANLNSYVHHHCATNSTHVRICKVYIVRNCVATKINPAFRLSNSKPNTTKSSFCRLAPFPFTFRLKLLAS